MPDGRHRRGEIPAPCRGDQAAEGAPGWLRRRLQRRVGFLGHRLEPHLRRPDQPKTKIDVVYGEAKGGKLEAVAQALRSIMLLETVAERMADTYAWPAPFAIEMQSCGYPNGQWLPKAHKVVLCYELAGDFGDLSRLWRPARGRRAAEAAGALKPDKGA